MRASIIKKGMIYSPSYGDIDFTVPLFGDYLLRNWIDSNTQMPKTTPKPQPL